MSNKPNNSSGGSNIPSEFKDPFNHDSINRVSFMFRKNRSMFNQNKFHHATVYLENGNTKGEQDFYDDDPELLRKKVENFINNLK
jgi:hypothetical protein